MCLPMPPDVFAGEVFGQLDAWRTRFLALKETREVLVLGDRKDVPHWLEGTGINAWERGNNWVLRMARASGAKRLVLIALWDGNNEGDGPGGTAHMIRLAEKAGNFDIRRLDAGQLLGREGEAVDG